MRQFLNVVFAIRLEGMDREQREEFLLELSMPLDPMEQYDYVQHRIAGGMG